MDRDRLANTSIKLLTRIGINPWIHGLGVPDGHRRARGSNTLLKRVLLTVRWCIGFIFFYRQRRAALAPLIRVRAKEAALSDQKCLIVGSGAVSTNTLQKIKELALDPNVRIMVMNHFDQSRLFGSITVQYWLMLDRGAQQGHSNDKSAKTWETIGSLPECSVVVPWQDFRTTEHAKKIAVENHSLAGVTNNIGPLWPRGYEGKSCLKAICLADYFGFEEILVAGCSNDYFKHATVKDGYVDAYEVKEFSPISAEDYFQNIANEFAYQRMVLSKIKSRVTFLS